jgi:hypothetical protein
MINAACGDDIEGNSRTGADETSSSTFDLRPYMRSERDPEDNPRALVEALGALAGAKVAQQLNNLVNMKMESELHG